MVFEAFKIYETFVVNETRVRLDELVVDEKYT